MFRNVVLTSAVLCSWVAVSPVATAQVADAPIKVREGNLVDLGLKDVNSAHQLWLGAEVVAAEDVLRAHLDLPQGHGVVVTKVQEPSPAAAAGLKQHDIVLTLSGHAMTDAASLERHLNEHGDKRAAMVVLRGGKKMTLEIKPEKRVWRVSTVRFQPNQYWIGLHVAVADETLRAQLQLGEQHGLVVTQVEDGSPAAKAEVQVHDLLTEFGGKPLAKTEDLREQVAEVADRPATLKLLRGGVQKTLKVQPEKRTIAVYHGIVRPPIEYRYLDVERPMNLVVDWKHLAGSHLHQRDAHHEVTEILKQVKILTQRLESLERTLHGPSHGHHKDEPAEKPADQD